MGPRLNFIYFICDLIGTAIFFYAAYRRFYLCRNVDRLERAGKLKPRVAAWIRQNPKASSGWMWIIVGCSFLFLAFARLWG